MWTRRWLRGDECWWFILSRVWKWVINEYLVFMLTLRNEVHPKRPKKCFFLFYFLFSWKNMKESIFSLNNKCAEIFTKNYKVVFISFISLTATIWKIQVCHFLVFFFQIHKHIVENLKMRFLNWDLPLQRNICGWFCVLRISQIFRLKFLFVFKDVKNKLFSHIEFSLLPHHKKITIFGLRMEAIEVQMWENMK